MSEKNLCLLYSRKSVEVGKKKLYTKPKTVLSETGQNFCVNFVTPKSTDNSQLGNYFLKVVGSTVRDEIEIRRTNDVLETTVPKSG